MDNGNVVNYAVFESERNVINGLISTIENEMNIANTQLNDATVDASGVWATTDIDDWTKIYNDINERLSNLQNLMAKATTAVQNTETTEKSQAGFSAAAQL